MKLITKHRLEYIPATRVMVETTKVYNSKTGKLMSEDITMSTKQPG